MNQSSLIIPPIAEGRIVEAAYNIYKDLLENTKSLNPPICSLCASYVGINKVRPRSHFHGSEFGKCFRATQLSTTFPKEKNEDQYVKNLFLYDGHVHEDTILDLLSQTYKVTHRNEEKIIERNVSVGDINETVKIVLHTDGILVYDINNYKFIIELKSVKDWFWKNRLLKEMIPNSYYGQSEVYMEAYNIPYTLLIFKNRHTSEISRPFIIPKDDEYINKRFAYLAGILASTKIPEIVPREYTDKKCDECVFCDYHKECWGD